MKLAFISDIHGNLEALNVALEIIEGQAVDEIICLGDVVGYGANPCECLELVRLKTDKIILGNHDAAAVEKTDPNYFNEFAREAVFWTQSVLSEDQKTFLKSLPLSLKMDALHLVHGSPDAPEHWNYIFSPYDAIRQFAHIDGDVCFVGHSHVSGDYFEGDPETGKRAKRIINVGSVGQPRDHDPRLCFATYETESDEVEFIREEYDSEVAAAKIRAAGLPAFLADRLGWGR